MRGLFLTHVSLHDRIDRIEERRFAYLGRLDVGRMVSHVPVYAGCTLQDSLVFTAARGSFFKLDNNVEGKSLLIPVITG